MKLPPAMKFAGTKCLRVEEAMFLMKKTAIKFKILQVRFVIVFFVPSDFRLY